jgi:nucleotide-binding universal stress UspA family protein
MSDVILIGYDGSAAAEHAIRSARELLNAQVAIVVTVWEPALPAMPLTVGDGFTTVAEPDPETTQEIDDLSKSHGERIAMNGARLAEQAGFATEALTVPDARNVAETLAALATERQAAAIVVGSKGHSALHDRLLGSTSSGVMHRAPCPVLVVPAEREA